MRNIAQTGVKVVTTLAKNTIAKRFPIQSEITSALRVAKESFKSEIKDQIKTQIKDPFVEHVKDVAKSAFDGGSEGLRSGLNAEPSRSLDDIAKKVNSDFSKADAIKEALLKGNRENVRSEVKETSLMMNAVLGLSDLAIERSPEQHRKKVAEVASKTIAGASIILSGSKDVAHDISHIAGSAAGRSVKEVSDKVFHITKELKDKAVDLHQTTSSKMSSIFENMKRTLSRDSDNIIDNQPNVSAYTKQKGYQR